MKDVYAITEGNGKGKSVTRWTRVGVAFDNRDGSLNVFLDAVPLAGRLQIRARDPKEKTSPDASGEKTN